MELTYLKNNGKMTSLELAELTGKRHDNLIASIQKMENSWVKIGRLKFKVTTYTDKSNRQSIMYDLSKTETLYIATKFNDEARAKLILRWEELETNNLKLPQTYSEALRLLADTKEQEEKTLLKLNQAENIIEENKSKVTFAESVVGSSNSILIRQFAKDLCDDTFKIGQNRLYQWFRENKYLMNDNSPYQNYVDMGLFEVITRSIGSGEETFTTKTTKITGKGMVYFTKKIKTEKQCVQLQQ